jgi:protocatechuate 3,4-dioxygenase beta subunit
MQRTLLIASLVFCLLGSVSVYAEEQVTLKSGARIIGSVALDGQTVGITIGDSQLVVPLSEVDTIAAVGTEAQQSPERLLMIALEARAQQGTSAGQVGLLAEAARQAPQDARIAYWYAQSLADAGLGSAAQAVLQKHRTKIEAELPGLVQRLSKQIQERIELEHLPARLAARIDQLNKGVNATSLRSDQLPMFVRFRLTDSTGQPVEKAAIRITCNGNDERLEAFEAGYYLFTFNSYRNNDQTECKLIVSSPGLEPNQFDLQPTADQVANGGNLIVKRYHEDDKLPVTILVTDQHGQSVEKATVTLRPQERDDDENKVQTASTDADGRVTFKAFPMNYTYTVVAKGFKNEFGRVELKRGSAEADPQHVKLYPTIAATIRFAWSATAPQSGELISNETTIEIGEGIPPMPYSPETMNFLRPVQDRDKLVLQYSPQFWGGPMAMATPWVRRAPADLLGESPLSFFKEFNLQKLGDVKDKWTVVDVATENTRRGPRLPFSFLAEQGQVYAGQIMGRDNRTGQPMLVSFKAYVEKVSTRGDAE